MDMFLVTAERERCSVPRSGNGRSGMGTRERFRSNDEKMHRKRRSSFRVHHSSIHRSGNSGDYRYVWTTFPLFLQPCMCILLIITLFPWLWAVHDTYCPIVVISSLFFSLIRIISLLYSLMCLSREEDHLKKKKIHELQVRIRQIRFFYFRGLSSN